MPSQQKVVDAEVQTQSAPESPLKESPAKESLRKESPLKESPRKDSPKKKGASQGKTISLRGTPKKKSPTLGQLASYQSQYRSPLKRLDPHDIDIKCIKARIAKLQDRQGTQRTPESKHQLLEKEKRKPLHYLPQTLPDEVDFDLNFSPQKKTLPPKPKPKPNQLLSIVPIGKKRRA